jgi:hypothetical protein
VTLDECSSCRLLLGPVDGSVMLRQCTEMRVSAVCRQLRTRECADCELCLFTLGPIIESSVRMAFGPWDASYPSLTSHFAAAHIDPNGPNRWKEVHDFNDPDRTAPHPNWTTLTEASSPLWEVATVPGDDAGAVYGRAENPVAVPGQLAGSSSSSALGAAPGARGGTARMAVPTIALAAAGATTVALALRLNAAR